MARKQVAGRAIEIHTKETANYKVIFSTNSTDELLDKMFRDNIVKHVGASGFEFECNSDLAYNMLIKTSAK